MPSLKEGIETSEGIPGVVLILDGPIAKGVKAFEHCIGTGCPLVQGRVLHPYVRGRMPGRFVLRLLLGQVGA